VDVFVLKHEKCLSSAATDIDTAKSGTGNNSNNNDIITESDDTIDEDIKIKNTKKESKKKIRLFSQFVNKLTQIGFEIHNTPIAKIENENENSSTWTSFYYHPLFNEQQANETFIEQMSLNAISLATVKQRAQLFLQRANKEQEEFQKFS
jgi:hypothetical protein